MSVLRNNMSVLNENKMPVLTKNKMFLLTKSNRSVLSENNMSALTKNSMSLLIVLYYVHLFNSDNNFYQICHNPKQRCTRIRLFTLPGVSVIKSASSQRDEY